LRAVRYAIIYRTHFVPYGTIFTETSLFYRYFVPKGTFFCRRHLFQIDALFLKEHFSADVIYSRLMLSSGDATPNKEIAKDGGRNEGRYAERNEGRYAEQRCGL